jgi:V/A-type H+-transporting ATPase subunit C
MSSIEEIIGLIAEESGIPLVFLIVGIIVVIMVMILLIGWILRIIMNVAPFAYPSARARAMKSKLLPYAKLDSMLEMPSTLDVISSLEGTDYEEYMAKIGGEDVSTLEHALYSSLRDSYASVMRMAPDAVKETFKARLKIYEVDALKTILRVLYAGKSVKEEIEHIPPMEGIDLESFYEIGSIEEFASRMESTEYGSVLSDAIVSYSEAGGIGRVEFALDRYAYENLWRAIRTASEENAKILEFFFGTELDVLNLKTVLRAKFDGMGVDEAKRYFLPMGYELSPEMLETLADCSDVESIVSAMEGRKCGEALMEALPKYESENSLIPLEMALDSHIARTGEEILTAQSLGVGPLIGYLSSKDIEVRNLRAIIKGIEVGLPPEKIKSLLVCTSQ